MNVPPETGPHFMEVNKIVADFLVAWQRQVGSAGLLFGRQQELTDPRCGDRGHVWIAVDKNGAMLFGAGGDECIHERQARVSRGSQVDGGLGSFA